MDKRYTLKPRQICFAPCDPRLLITESINHTHSSEGLFASVQLDFPVCPHMGLPLYAIKIEHLGYSWNLLLLLPQEYILLAFAYWFA